VSLAGRAGEHRVDMTGELFPIVTQQCRLGREDGAVACFANLIVDDRGDAARRDQRRSVVEREHLHRVLVYVHRSEGFVAQSEFVAGAPETERQTAGPGEEIDSAYRS
jgi:hypothetical protein